MEVGEVPKGIRWSAEAGGPPKVRIGGVSGRGRGPTILMQDTFRIPIRLDHNQDMYLLVAILLSLEDLLSKPWWQPPPIIQSY